MGKERKPIVLYVKETKTFTCKFGRTEQRFPNPNDCGVDSVYLAPIFGLSSAAVFLGECLGDLATGDSGILPVASILILKGNTSNVRGC